MSDVELTEAEAAALAKLNRRANEALGTVLIDNTSDPYDLPVGNKSHEFKGPDPEQWPAASDA